MATIALGVLAFIAVIVAAVVLTAVLTRMMSHSRRVGKTRSLIAAEYLAEAGLEHGLDRFLAALAAGGLQNINVVSQFGIADQRSAGKSGFEPCCAMTNRAPFSDKLASVAAYSSAAS